MVKTILKGTYCLLINLENDSKIRVGKLGELDFKKGGYVYVGSALNSLEGRIKRHLSHDKKLHWHVDYLLTHKDTKIMDVIYTVNDSKIECELARIIAKMGVGVDNFGCSDCKCHSHLFYFENIDDLEKYCLESYEKLGLSPRKFKKN
jgi:Uri superfamily endonuclease